MKASLKNLSLLLYCGLSMFACTSHSESEIRRFDIDQIRASREQFALTNPLVFIPLETNQDCLIGSIEKLILTKDYIFVFTKNLFYQFDTNGKFIRKIGSEGRGPAEYGFILDVSVDETTGKIFICDNSSRKVNIYNMSGEYLGTKERNGFWRRFEVINDMFAVYPLNLTGKEPCMLKLIESNDSSTCFTNNILFEPNDIFLNYDIKNFQKLNNKLIFHQQFNDTIYKFNPEKQELSVGYYFDFGNLRFPVELLGSLQRFNDESQGYGYVYDVCENNDFVFLTITYRGQSEKYVINKKSGKCYTVGEDQQLIWPLWTDEKGTLISCIQATKLINHKEEITDVNLKNLASQIKAEDNPVVVLIR